MVLIWQHFTYNNSGKHSPIQLIFFSLIMWVIKTKSGLLNIYNLWCSYLSMCVRVWQTQQPHKIKMFTIVCWEGREQFTGILFTFTHLKNIPSCSFQDNSLCCPWSRSQHPYLQMRGVTPLRHPDQELMECFTVFTCLVSPVSTKPWLQHSTTGTTDCSMNLKV